MGSKANPFGTDAPWSVCVTPPNRPFDEKGRFGGLYASYPVTIGDDSYVVALTQAFAEGIEQGGFPRAHRPADTDFDVGVWHMEPPRLPSASSSPIGKGGKSTGSVVPFRTLTLVQ